MNIISRLSFIDCRLICEVLNEIIVLNLYIRFINLFWGWICGVEGLFGLIKGIFICFELSVYLCWRYWVFFINKELVLIWLFLIFDREDSFCWFFLICVLIKDRKRF